MGDLEPGGLGRYMEHKSMVTAMDKFVMSDINTGPFELCKFMHMAPIIQSERRIVDEASRLTPPSPCSTRRKSFLLPSTAYHSGLPCCLTKKKELSEPLIEEAMSAIHICQQSCGQIEMSS